MMMCTSRPALITPVTFDRNPTDVRGVVMTKFNIEKFTRSRAVTLQDNC